MVYTGIWISLTLPDLKTITNDLKDNPVLSPEGITCEEQSLTAPRKGQVAIAASIGKLGNTNNYLHNHILDHGNLQVVFDFHTGSC